jgi:hypothetical protein
MIRALSCAVILLLAFGVLPANALEPFAVYDNFNALTIDPAKWSQAETTRQIKNNKLLLSTRGYGLAGSDTGLHSEGTGLNFSGDQSAITAMKATVTVTKIGVTDCASNTGSVTEARAAVSGHFFNIGTPTTGSYLNDVVGQIRTERASDSTEPSDILHVKAVVFVCTNDSCSNGASVAGNAIDMGYVQMGSPVTIWMQWDKANNRFLFKRDLAPWVIIHYSQSDATPPSQQMKGIGVSTYVANCNSLPLPDAFVEATFDNVAVNASAVPAP